MRTEIFSLSFYLAIKEPSEVKATDECLQDWKWLDIRFMEIFFHKSDCCQIKKEKKCQSWMVGMELMDLWYSTFFSYYSRKRHICVDPMISLWYQLTYLLSALFFFLIFKKNLKNLSVWTACRFLWVGKIMYEKIHVNRYFVTSYWISHCCSASGVSVKLDTPEQIHIRCIHVFLNRWPSHLR